MNRAVLAIASALTLAAASAQAADLPVKAPPLPPPPVFSWTGLYLGVEGGGGWGSVSYLDNSVVGLPLGGTPISQSPSGGIFGGVLGLRYQTGQFVFGLEGTGAWADLTSTFVPVAGTTDSFKVRSLYTATGQVGWAFNQALVYVKGGWASASVDTSITIPAIGAFATQRQTDNGWTLGVGLDYALWQSLVLGIEYDHFDLGYNAFSTVGVLGSTYTVGNPSRLTIEQVVGRLTYKFNLFNLH
jgi:outer membrane immunogenic protein